MLRPTTGATWGLHRFSNLWYLEVGTRHSWPNAWVGPFQGRGAAEDYAALVWDRLGPLLQLGWMPEPWSGGSWTQEPYHKAAWPPYVFLELLCR